MNNWNFSSYTTQVLAVNCVTNCNKFEFCWDYFYDTKTMKSVVGVFGSFDQYWIHWIEISSWYKKIDRL